MDMFRWEDWSAALLAFGAVALAVLALAMGFEGIRGILRSRSVMKELKRIRETGTLASIQSSLLRADRTTLPDWLRPIGARLPSLRDVELLLEQSRSSWSLGTVLLLTVGCGGATGSAVLVGTRNGVVALVMAAFGATLPLLWLMRARAKRFRNFESAFPEAIDLLVRSVRAGHALPGALKVVAEEAPDPVAGEFQQVFDEQKFGLPVAESLLGLVDRVNILDVRMFVTSVLIHRETGGNLAENLEGLARVIRERFKFRRDVQTRTAHGRMTGLVLAIAPVATLAGFQLANPEYVRPLFTQTVGQYLLLAAFGLQILGFLVIRSMTTVEF